MKVTQEKLPRSQMGLFVEVEAEKSKLAYEKLVRDYMRTAKIPGFRPGKAPRQLVLQFYGKDRVKAAALESLIDSSFKEALAQEEIASLGNMQLRESFEALLSRYQPGEPLSFNAAVDVQPEVTLGPYTGLTVEYAEVPYDSSEVDTLLEQYRDKRAVLVPVEDRPAQAGDTATVDFVGSKADGSEIPGGKAEDFEIELVEGKFIPGFIEGTFGMQVGESRTLDLQFPEDYPQEDLAGIPARFEIVLKDLKFRELPALDDDFTKDISEYETLAELRTFLEQQTQEQAAEKTRTNRDAAIIKALIDQASAELPDTLVNREIQFLAEQSVRNLQQQGIDPSKIFTEENMPRLRESLRKDAETRLLRTLALAQVARLENIQVDEAAVLERVASLQSEIEEEVSQQALQDFAREEMLTEKILEWLAEHSTIEVVPPEALSAVPSLEDDSADPPQDEADGPATDDSTDTLQGEADEPATET